MIRPTLFVGLGTTGTNILKYLRRLMFEEYGRAGLPIIRYVAIETDGREDGEDAGLRMTKRMEHYEQIKVIRATISSTAAVEAKIMPGNALYDKNLASWLSPDLTKIGEKSFEAGAKNIRMAGRLCLWENWQHAEQVLREANNAISAPSNVDDATKLLKLHAERKKMPLEDRLVDPDATDIYVVGSLCGGSCSGMLYDIAYFFRSLYRGVGGQAGTAGSKLYGIFTMYDAEQATQPNNKVRAANCYGALHEFNYYNHRETSYSITFPSGHRAVDIKDPPFDYTMFVSRTGKQPFVRFNKPDGTFDEMGLNQMISLNLFADISGGADSKKNAIRTDWHGHHGYRELKSVNAGEAATMVRCMASFGLAAVWYPKYRIATGAAALVGQDVCRKWLSPQLEHTVIKKKGEQACHDLIAKHIDSLTAPAGGLTLEREIGDLLNQATSQLQQAPSAKEFETALRNFPRGDAFQRRFDKGGQYYTLIEDQVPKCRDAMVKDLWELLRDQLKMVHFDGDYAVGDILAFFSEFDKALDTFLKECPARLPTLEIEKLQFGPLAEAERNLGLKLVSLRQKAVEQVQNHLIRSYRAMVEHTRKQLRNYFLRPIGETLRTELGFGLKPDTDEIEEKKTIQRTLELIQLNLEDQIVKFESEFMDAKSVPTQINVAIVANNPDNRVDLDIKRLARKIDPNSAARELLEDRTMAELLTMDGDALHTLIKEAYRHASLDKFENFHVVTKALELLNTGGSNIISKVARQSLPFQTFDACYQELKIPTPATLISGHELSSGELARLQTELTKHNHMFARTNQSQVDHLVFFYHEEAGFALDDLTSFDMLQARFDDRPGPYGHLTRMDEVYFDIEYALKKEQLDVLIKGLRLLVPVIREYRADIFDNVLTRGPIEDVCYSYAIDHTLNNDLHLSNPKDGVAVLSEARNKQAFKWFVYHMHCAFTALGQDWTYKIVNHRLTQMQRAEREENRELLEKFLNEIYKEKWSTAPDLPDPTVSPQKKLEQPATQGPTHATTSNQAFQSYQGTQTQTPWQANNPTGSHENTHQQYSAHTQPPPIPKTDTFNAMEPTGHETGTPWKSAPKTEPPYTPQPPAPGFQAPAASDSKPEKEAYQPPPISYHQNSRQAEPSAKPAFPAPHPAPGFSSVTVRDAEPSATNQTSFQTNPTHAPPSFPTGTTSVTPPRIPTPDQPIFPAPDANGEAPSSGSEEADEDKQPMIPLRPKMPTFDDKLANRVFQNWEPSEPKPEHQVKES